MKSVILKTKNLCKSFANDGEQNHVLNNIDLEIYEGDFTVIMGPSGSGKSTLLYSLSGMDKLTCGEIKYKSEVISNYNEKELTALRCGEFSFVFQQSHLVSNLTLFENIVVPGFLNKNKSANEVKKRAESLIETMNLKGAKKRLPSQVSGGEQQRAAIARVLINEPSIIFADEPTGALNRNNTNTVLDLLTKVNMNKQSIVMVTHDLNSAIRGNRILYIEDGRICGELTLSPFTEQDIKSREAQVNAWLSSMAW